jgi:hypothetical protein
VVDTILALLLRLMRRVRFVFIGVYIVVAVGFLYADPRSGWTWFIVGAGALLCLLFWGLVGLLGAILHLRQQGRDGKSGADNG